MQYLEFDGTGRQSILVLIASLLIISLTFGIALPWATTIRQSWIAKHTLINGKRMTFTGTGSALFGKWIVWWFLSLITFGVFGLVVWARYQKWIVEHTAVVE